LLADAGAAALQAELNGTADRNGVFLEQWRAGIIAGGDMMDGCLMPSFSGIVKAIQAIIGEAQKEDSKYPGYNVTLMEEVRKIWIRATSENPLLHRYLDDAELVQVARRAWEDLDLKGKARISARPYGYTSESAKALAVLKERQLMLESKQKDLQARVRRKFEHRNPGWVMYGRYTDDWSPADQIANVLLGTACFGSDKGISFRTNFCETFPELADRLPKTDERILEVLRLYQEATPGVDKWAPIAKFFSELGVTVSASTLDSACDRAAWRHKNPLTADELVGMHRAARKLGSANKPPKEKSKTASGDGRKSRIPGGK
jgi:hypothetical protein